MAILKSAFWLGIAFVAIGPYADWEKSARSAAHDVVGATTTIAQEQLAHVECTQLACDAQKLIVAHGVRSLNSQVTTLIGKNDGTSEQTMLETPSPLLSPPMPMPRLFREG